MELYVTKRALNCRDLMMSCESDIFANRWSSGSLTGNPYPVPWVAAISRHNFQDGKAPPDAYINGMPHKGPSPHTLDLFEVTLTIPTPLSEPAPGSAKAPALASLSDVQLAQQLVQLVEEVQRRLEKGRGRRPELEAAATQARASLDRLASRRTSQARPLRSAKGSSPLQEGQRKAVRAALVAGVAPTQVAKHFGLPLATIRKVLDEAG
jgi:hypothetical protein